MVEKSITGIVTWLKNWFYDSDQVDTFLNSKANKNLGTAGMNVVTDASGEISLEAKPTIPTVPSASSTTPSADTNSGAVGTGTTWARADHKHPKSSIYAEASHDHTVSEITDFPSTMTPSSHTHGNLTNDGKLGTTANKPVITGTGGAITTGSFGTSANSFCEGNDSRLSDARTPTAHNQATSTITNSEAYNNIKSGESSTLTLTSQKLINDAINTKIGQLSQIKAFEMVSTLPTASASTMGVLYVINESNKINFYYTENTGTSQSPTYAWHKMDTDILDELIVNWSDVQGKPSTFTPSSHTHGNLQNDGTILNANGTLNVGGIVATDNTTGQLVGYNTLQSFRIKDPYAHSNIGSSADDTQQTINGLIDTALGTKITKSSSATGLLRDDGTVDTTTYLSSLPSHSHNTSLISDTGDLKIMVGNNNVANLGYWLNTNMGYKTDDIDWSYNSNGFVNGIKLHDKTATGDDATGTITFHLKS